MALAAEAPGYSVPNQKTTWNQRMKANECMKVLAKHRADAVVVCALGMIAEA